MTARSQVGIDIVARDMASREVQAVGGSLRNFGGQADEAGRRVGLLGSVAQHVWQGVFLGVGLMAVQKVTQAFGMIPNAIFATNASLEQSQMQFTTLFKDADRAREHVAMLFEFAKRTPFETGPIINASRVLQTFGGDALNTQEKLTMIGDAAAGASTDIGEVAFWVGRAYAAIKGGQPFGEARMRLQELALLSPQAAAEMERLQKAGADTTEVWEIMEGELGKFGGAMERQAESWQGLTSTLMDTFNLTVADAFKGLFDQVKGGMKTVIAVLSSPEFGAAVKEIGRIVVTVVGWIIDAAKEAWPTVQAALQAIVGLAKAVAPVVMAVFGALWTGIKFVVDIVAGFVRFLTDSEGKIKMVAIVVGTVVVAAFTAWAISAAAAAVATLAALAPFILIGTVIGVAIWAFLTLTESLGILKPMLDAVAFAADVLYKALKFVIDVVMGLIDVVHDALVWLGILKEDTAVAAESMATGFDSMAASSRQAAEDVADSADTMAVGFDSMASKSRQAADDMVTNTGGAMDDMLAQLKAGEGPMGAAAGGLGDALANPLLGGVKDAESAVNNLPKNMVTDLEGGWDAVQQAAEELAERMENPISGAARIAELRGQLHDENLIKGLKSKDPLVREAAEKLKASIEGEILALQNAAETYGRRTANEYAAGLQSRIAHVGYVAKMLTSEAQRFLEAGSPPGPDSPLHRIGEWGAKTAEAWREAFIGGIGATGIPLRAELANIRDLTLPVQASPIAFAATSGGGAAVQQIVHQEFHFGPGSVRGDDDIRRLGIEMQERAQLQGFAATAREVGRAVA